MNFLIGPEGKMEAVGKLRPEFPQDVPRHSIADAEANPARRGPKAAWISRMIEISKGLGACCAQPF